MKNIRAGLLAFYTFCPHCGKRFSKIRLHGKTELVCTHCGYTHWLNSKPTASCILVNAKNEILLAKRAVNPYKGYWDVPGGFLDVGERPEVGLRREMKEELGIALPSLSLVGVYLDTYGVNPAQATLNFYYTARVKTTIRLLPQDDINDAKWFPIRKLPKNIAFKNGRDAIRDFRKR